MLAIQIVIIILVTIAAVLRFKRLFKIYKTKDKRYYVDGKLSLERPLRSFLIRFVVGIVGIFVLALIARSS